MSSCYKCGKELPGAETECEYGCGGDGVMQAPLIPIDFDRVKTPEDVRLLFSLINMHLHVAADHPHIKQLMRFLKS